MVDVDVARVPRVVVVGADEDLGGHEAEEGLHGHQGGDLIQPERVVRLGGRVAERLEIGPGVGAPLFVELPTVAAGIVEVAGPGLARRLVEAAPGVLPPLLDELIVLLLHEGVEAVVLAGQLEVGPARARGGQALVAEEAVGGPLRECGGVGELGVEVEGLEAVVALAVDEAIEVHLEARLSTQGLTRAPALDAQPHLELLGAVVEERGHIGAAVGIEGGPGLVVQGDHQLVDVLLAEDLLLVHPAARHRLHARVHGRAHRGGVV